MRFAFSTVSCPKWDFETIASKASELGYDGVEIRGFLNESILTAANVFLTDPAKVRTIFDSAKVKIACLASSIAMSSDRRKNDILAQDARRYIDTAALLGCPIVKVFDMQLNPGQNRGRAAVGLGNWLAPLGDYAAGKSVTIVVENALSFRTAKEMWLMLESINHPNVAAAWDIFNAAQIGESPFVSVPTLNSRIQYTQVKDAKLGPMGAAYCKLGEGDVPVAQFLTRLRGIGYDGDVTLEWEKAWLPNIAEPDEILPDAIAKLKEWTKPFEPEKPAKKAVPAKKEPAPKKEPAAPAT